MEKNLFYSFQLTQSIIPFLTSHLYVEHIRYGESIRGKGAKLSEEYSFHPLPLIIWNKPLCLAPLIGAFRPLLTYTFELTEIQNMSYHCRQSCSIGTLYC